MVQTGSVPPVSSSRLKEMRGSGTQQTQSRKALKHRAKVITAHVSARASTSRKMAATDQKHVTRMKEANIRPAGLAAESLGSRWARRHNAWAIAAATAAVGGSLSSRQSWPSATQPISGSSFMAFHFLPAKDAPPSSTIALSPMSPKRSEIVYLLRVV